MWHFFRKESKICSQCCKLKTILAMMKKKEIPMLLCINIVSAHSIHVSKFFKNYWSLIDFPVWIFQIELNSFFLLFHRTLFDVKNILWQKVYLLQYWSAVCFCNLSQPLSSWPQMTLCHVTNKEILEYRSSCI